jgi:peptidoglycan/LPS O-acetylase OafA/YrhL
MSAPETAPAPRLDYLDGLRGWASLMVVLSHLWGQFARHNSDFYSSTPLRLISDGHFAVLIFFVLSGTALSLRYTRRPQPVALGWLVAARYVRLVVPIAATTLIAYVLLKLQWYGGADAATAANSPVFLGPRHGLPTTFADAARFALFDVLFRYDEASSFNSGLWTMPVEFLGSILIYGLLFALSLAPWLRRGHRIAIACVLAGALMIAAKPLAACFCAGYVIAEILFAAPRVQASGRWIGAALLAVAAALLAAHGELDDRRGAILATGTVMSVASWPLLRRILSADISRWLGTISFPLYLVHVPLIDCAGKLFMALLRDGFAPAIATHVTVVVTVPACLLAARILMPVERWSIRWSRAVGNHRRRPRKLATTPT